MTDVMLDVRGLSAFYGQAQILFDVDIQVRHAEVLALTGRNGAGKSTLLKALMGLVRRPCQFCQFMGQDLIQLETHEIARLGLGYVAEDRRIFTDLTVMENLEVGRKPARGTASAQAWTPERLFEIFPNLARMRQRLGGQMSGGEQQMLAIARTLMGNPRLILLDEPSEGLSPVIVEDMAQAVLRMKAEGLSILLAEQNEAFTKAISDRTLRIERGRLR